MSGQALAVGELLITSAGTPKSLVQPKLKGFELLYLQAEYQLCARALFGDHQMCTASLPRRRFFRSCCLSVAELGMSGATWNLKKHGE